VQRPPDKRYAGVLGTGVQVECFGVPVPCTVRVPETVPSPMVTVPVACNPGVGAKWTASAQVLAGRQAGAQPLPRPEALPGAETVSGPVAPRHRCFVMVKVASALTALIEMEPKSYELRDTVSAPGGRPMPKAG